MTNIADVLALLGNISSIAGFSFTVWILLKLRRIHRSYLLQARFPDLHRRVRRHCSNLEKLLNVYPDSALDIQAELQKCDATIESLLPKVERALRADVKNLLDKIARVFRTGSPPSKEEVRRIYLDLIRLEAELQNLSEDMKWRPQR